MSTLKVNNIQNANGTSAIAIDSSGVATFSKTLVPSSSMMYRNIIINGDMRIAQRGTTFPSATNGDYTLDRFGVTQIGAGVATINQVNDSPTASEAGTYNNTCLEVDVTTADTSIASNDMYSILQTIEGNNIVGSGFGQSGTRYVTLSFWVKTNKTGIYCVGLTNTNWGALERTYVAEYTVSSADTWEKKTITVPVDTTGTWAYNNTAGLSVRFSLYAGSDFHITKDTWITGSSNYNPSTSNQVNLFDSISNYFRITLVQLEVGDAATPFEHRPYGAELALCQRYYQPVNAISGNASSTNGLSTNISFVVPMRATPSISVESALKIYDGVTTFTQSSANAGSYLGNEYGGLWYSIANFSGLTQYRPYGLNTNANQNAVRASSEL